MAGLVFGGAFFKWLPEYSVNIQAIDDQHKELVAILNRLFVAVSRLEGDKVIAGILDSLTDYTRTHFALEEQLMRQAKNMPSSMRTWKNTRS